MKVDGRFVRRCVEASWMSVEKEVCVVHFDFLYVKECCGICFYQQNNNTNARALGAYKRKYFLDLLYAFRHGLKSLNNEHSFYPHFFSTVSPL